MRDGENPTRGGVCHRDTYHARVDADVRLSGGGSVDLRKWLFAVAEDRELHARDRHLALTLVTYFLDIDGRC